MSTFTTIKTAIRDAGAMHRVLQAIPGAKINRSVTLPLKAGGYGRFEFMVELAGGAGASSLLGALFGRGLRFFSIYRDTDGTLTIEICQDQQGSRNIESQVAAALDQHQCMLAAEEQRRAQERDEERQRILRMIEEERQRPQAQERTRKELTPKADAPRVSEAALRAEQERARGEAEAILAQFDSRRNATAATPSATPPTPDGSVRQELSHVLSQQYAKEKVMEQVAQMEQQYGVRLSGEEVFEDGTVEITLRG